jgi:c(7)-type cytochrome triheme protein
MFCLAALCGAAGWAADAIPDRGVHAGFSPFFAPKTPKELVFTSTKGDVTFNHALHAKRESNNCKACHDKLFPESSAPLNFKSAEHKTAETAKTSCGGCHYPGGDAFEAKGNCAKCHAKS